MTEFIAKKLAEVGAFLQLSGVIVQRAGQPFADTQPQATKQLTELSHASVVAAITPDMRSVFDTKLQKITDKLTDMMQLYIGDEWDNPTEVLEWCSFFTGAAAAHCALASELTDEHQKQIDDLRAAYESALQSVVAGLRAVGASKK